MTSQHPSLGKIPQAMALLALALPFWIGSRNPFNPPSVSAVNSSSVVAPLEAEFNGCGGSAIAPVNSDFEQQVVELVNAERASRGLPPLKRASSLDDAARYHAADMQQDAYFDHNTYDKVQGKLQFVCYWNQRIQNYYNMYTWLGENIAWGYTTPQGVMNGWMNSQGHRNNILNSEFWEIGVGYYDGNYWVQDFGRRSGVYPLVINNEAAQTDSPQVTLYVYGTWNEMRLRNDDQPWTAWQRFQNSLTWQLPNVRGEHTVTVEMRTSTKSATSSDSIFLNASASPRLGNLPDQLTIIYSRADRQFVPSSIVLTPLNVGNEEPLNWEVSSTVDWFALDSPQGTTPAPLTIIPIEPLPLTTTSANGAITVTATWPPEVAGSPHTIMITLITIDVPFQKLYLPLLNRSGP